MKLAAETLQVHIVKKGDGESMREREGREQSINPEFATCLILTEKDETWARSCSVDFIGICLSIKMPIINLSWRFKLGQPRLVTPKCTWVPHCAMSSGPSQGRSGNVLFRPAFDMADYATVIEGLAPTEPPTRPRPLPKASVPVPPSTSSTGSNM